ncbi:hypothetical protein MRX96_039065 [Rhipicephalus microplus]
MSGGADKGHGRDGTRALRQMPRAPISIADAAHAQCTEQQSSTAVAPSGNEPNLAAAKKEKVRSASRRERHGDRIGISRRPHRHGH